jgi:hypothetical protein
VVLDEIFISFSDEEMNVGIRPFRPNSLSQRQCQDNIPGKSRLNYENLALHICKIKGITVVSSLPEGGK